LKRKVWLGLGLGLGLGLVGLGFGFVAFVAIRHDFGHQREGKKFRPNKDLSMANCGVWQNFGRVIIDWSVVSSGKSEGL